MSSLRGPVDFALDRTPSRLCSAPTSSCPSERKRPNTEGADACFSCGRRRSQPTESAASTRRRPAPPLPRRRPRAPAARRRLGATTAPRGTPRLWCFCPKGATRAARKRCLSRLLRTKGGSVVGRIRPGESAQCVWKQRRMDGGAKAKLRPRRCGADPADGPLGSMPGMGSARRRTRSVRSGSA
jgi:hypothetical protein